MVVMVVIGTLLHKGFANILYVNFVGAGLWQDEKESNIFPDV